jgi:hypothetical protein
MALQPVTKLIDEHRYGIPTGQPRTAQRRSDAQWEKRTERAGKGMVVAGMAGFCLMMLSLVPLGMAHLKGTDTIVLWTVEILAVLLFGGVGLVNLPRVVKAIANRRTARTGSVPPVESTKELTTASDHEPVPSVTEATTRSLETINKG